MKEVNAEHRGTCGRNLALRKPTWLGVAMPGGAPASDNLAYATPTTQLPNGYTHAMLTLASSDRDLLLDGRWRTEKWSENAGRHNASGQAQLASNRMELVFPNRRYHSEGIGSLPKYTHGELATLFHSC